MKILLTETEKNRVDEITQRIKEGMSTEEIINTYGAITFEEFEKKFQEKIDKRYMIKSQEQ